MENIGKVAYYTIGSGELKDVANRTWLTITSIDLATLMTTYLIMALMLIVTWFVAQNLKEIPGRVQLLAEWIVGGIDQLCKESLGEKLGRSFTPFITTIFVFLALCNYSGVFFFQEPTKDINLTLSLALIGFFVALYQAFRFQGVFGYFWALFWEPIPVIMFPLNVIGELSKIISISFRLFGNILGGSVIIAVVSWLVNYLVLPIGLNAFFGVFVGTIQAFVFTMLTLAYISQGIELEEEAAV
ncbi:MAG: ATP synthase F0 subunit A [Candidatus Cloacimonadota bacterium]|nr:MAG: ATP synthase F0 subunit A [Candidatus Cloacimonadota bacterium]